MKKSNRVLVIGDVLLDRYVMGQVKRISPEAPIPIVNIIREKEVLGGAANVAYNIASLGGEVTLMGVCGYDYESEKIFAKLEINNINNSIIRADNVKTIVKTRILGNNQQIARLDYNDNMLLTEAIKKKISNKFETLVSKHSVLVISDYGKGLLEEKVCEYLIRRAKDNQLIVIVDPKGTNWNKYRNCNIITPNFKELELFYNKSLENTNESIKKETTGFCSNMNIDYLLLTRSEKGMSLIDKNNKFMHFDTDAKSVYDVSGAGDTVVAILALFWNEQDKDRIIQLANRGAGIVVGKKGTAAVTMEELNELLYDADIQGKIIDLENLIDKLSKIRDSKKIVFTNGCFDILHPGHMKYLKRASQLGDFMIVAINSDDSVKRLKGENRPINSERDRAYMLASMPFIDNVIIFDEEDPRKILSKITPDVLVKGGDYEEQNILGREYVKDVKIIEFFEGYSTTSIVKKIRNS